MTTSEENLARFAEGNKNRGEFLTKLFDLLTTTTVESDDPDLVVLAASAAADIALRDSETEQREIANLIAVADSPDYTQLHRDRARQRILTMLELNR